MVVRDGRRHVMALSRCCERTGSAAAAKVGSRRCSHGARSSRSASRGWPSSSTRRRRRSRLRRPRRRGPSRRPSLGGRGRAATLGSGPLRRRRCRARRTAICSTSTRSSRRSTWRRCRWRTTGSTPPSRLSGRCSAPTGAWRSTSSSGGLCAPEGQSASPRGPRSGSSVGSCGWRRRTIRRRPEFPRRSRGAREERLRQKLARHSEDALLQRAELTCRFESVEQAVEHLVGALGPLLAAPRQPDLRTGVGEIVEQLAAQDDEGVVLQASYLLAEATRAPVLY